MKYPLTVSAIVILIIMAIIISLMGVRLIGPGEVGVITRFGKVTGRVLQPGGHLVVPIVNRVLKYDTKKVIYETRREVDERPDEGTYLDHKVDTNTKDGQQVNIYFTVRFSVDPTQATWVAQNIGSQDSLVNKIVRTESRIWARGIPREYVAADLYSGNIQDVQNAIADKLRPVFLENGVLLDEVGIREIEFEKQYVQAIEDKQIAAVEIETERNRAEQAKFEKERRITQAEAAAQEQSLQRETLSGQVLQKILIEKWNGRYPETLILGDSGQFILPLPQGASGGGE